jgi:hypothetical protein
MSTWGLANTGTPPVDFGDISLEDRLYTYLLAKWTLTGDLHVSKFSTTNRPNPGRAGYWLSVSAAGGESGRTYTDSPYVQPTIGIRDPIPFVSTMRIRFFSKRPKQGLIFPELQRMVQEAMRIIYQYHTDRNILGIIAIDRFRWSETNEASRDMGREYNNIYKIDALVDLHYAKVSTV